MNQVPQDLLLELHRHQQEHLVHFWDQLTDAHRERLCQQIRQIDFDQIRRLWLKASGQSYSEFTSTSRVNRAKAPATVVRQPADSSSESRWQKAVEIGEQELRNNRVAVITVAGGQGTRLGFDHPKGLFPIGPVTDRSLFQIFAEQILARRRRHECEVPWFVMTSDATHDETVAFFRSSRFFGLPETPFASFSRAACQRSTLQPAECCSAVRQSLHCRPTVTAASSQRWIGPVCLMTWLAEEFGTSFIIRLIIQP